jgi:hypothetical protein
VGGHQSVRDEIVEDHAIARVFKEKAYKILVADGKPLYSVRMYTDLESMWQGWTKNLYSLIDSRVFNLIMILAVINWVIYFPWVEVGILGRMLLSGETFASMQSLVLMVLLQFILLAAWFGKATDHHQGISWRHFFLLPLGGIVVTALYLHAAYLVLTGSQVNWKGRRYTVNTSKTIQPVASQTLDVAIGQEGSEV